MTSQFVKVGSQFINMAHVEVVRTTDTALWLDFNADTEDGNTEMFVGQERADLLAWLNANAQDVSQRTYVDLPYPHGRVALADDDKDAELRKMRKDLDALWKLLRAIDDTAPQFLEQLSADGYGELAAQIEEVRASLPTPF